MSPRAHLLPILATTVALSLALGCGGSRPKEQTAPTEDPTPRKNQASDVSVSAEVGGLNEEAARKVFERAEPGFERCFKRRAAKVVLLSGTVKFFVIIGLDQKAKSVTVEESDLGDRETEICMQKVLFGLTWPKPVGGRTAHAHYAAAPFEPLDPDLREATTVDPDQVSKVTAKLRKQLQETCQIGSPSPFQVTAYLDTSGNVLAAGVVSSDPNGELALDCIHELVKSTEFPTPGSYPGKVTFSL